MCAHIQRWRGRICNIPVIYLHEVIFRPNRKVHIVIIPSGLCKACIIISFDVQAKYDKDKLYNGYIHYFNHDYL